jgi:hypothetical protein
MSLVAPREGEGRRTEWRSAAQRELHGGRDKMGQRAEAGIHSMSRPRSRMPARDGLTTAVSPKLVANEACNGLRAVCQTGPQRRTRPSLGARAGRLIVPHRRGHVAGERGGDVGGRAVASLSYRTEARYIFALPLSYFFAFFGPFSTSYATVFYADFIHPMPFLRLIQRYWEKHQRRRISRKSLVNGG